MREAPSIVLASRLIAEGAEVRGWDPVADGAALPPGVEIADSVLDAVRGADAAVIVTEWAELRDLARDEVRDAMANPLIVDGRNLLDPAATRAAGFAYDGIGRPGLLDGRRARDARARARGRAEPLVRGGDRPCRRQGGAARRRGRRSPEVARRRRRAAARVVPGRPARAGRRVARDLRVRGRSGRRCSSASSRASAPRSSPAEEPERLGRGGGIKFAARERVETGDVFVLNGDELVDVDFAALLDRHARAGGAATVAVARPQVAVRRRRASARAT